MKVWDFDTGDQVFEFGEAHGQSAITCMTFDHRGRRSVGELILVVQYCMCQPADGYRVISLTDWSQGEEMAV